VKTLLLTLGVAAAWLVPFFALFGTVVLARRRFHLGKRRNPLTKNLLRGPAHALLERREDLFATLMGYIAVGPVMPLLLLAMYQTQLAAGERVPSAWYFSIVAIAAVGFSAFKITKIVRLLRSINLGIEAETAVGQELNWLMQDGFSVFHDVIGEGPFNVDHVIVGRQGVYAVETKGRSKPIKTDGSESHRVNYDGKALLFPGWSETAPLEQATRNAEWLKKWLSSAVGSPVDVRPVLMLPGWYIERTGPGGVAVMNGTNCRNFFTKGRDQPLSEQLVKQIVHQLDARCRSVEPTSYKPLKS
jgi:hypothetical protein